MKINSEIRLDVSRKDIVLKIDGVNNDGKKLLENYNYIDKHLDLVMQELLDRAIQMNFLNGIKIKTKRKITKITIKNISK